MFMLRSLHLIIQSFRILIRNEAKKVLHNPQVRLLPDATRSGDDGEHAAN